jgi:hypothetical protein
VGIAGLAVGGVAKKIGAEGELAIPAAVLGMLAGL